MQIGVVRLGPWSVCSQEGEPGLGTPGGLLFIESIELSSSLVPHKAAKICSGTAGWRYAAGRICSALSLCSSAHLPDSV